MVVKLVIVIVQEPVKTPHFIRTVVGTVAGTHTTVVCQQRRERPGYIAYLLVKARTAATLGCVVVAGLQQL